MATPVLIIGRSGAGKSASMRNCVGKDFALINVLKKPLPFKGKIPAVQTAKGTEYSPCTMIWETGFGV